MDDLTHTPEEISNYFRLQAHYCRQLGSPFYGDLIERIADDIAAGGPTAAVVEGYPHEPAASAMALRLMGAMHRRVLDGNAPELATHYPSVGGDGDGEAAWPLFCAHVAAHAAELGRVVAAEPVQTNEVARTAALVGGFLTVARETRLPLRCLEIGASAGLNLRWDHFRYEGERSAWGDPASPVVLRGCWKDGDPPFDVDAAVVERAGCDLRPIDATSDGGRLTLLSFLWPDQSERLRLLEAAIDVARRVPASVDCADAAQWLEHKLAEPAAGAATVVFHSIVIQYLDASTRDRVLRALATAGTRATAQAPLAHLRMEPGGEQTEVVLTMWPGGKSRRVATAGYHGRDVRFQLG